VYDASNRAVGRSGEPTDFDCTLPHLAQFIEKYPDALRPDAWIICDGPMHQSRRAQLAFGARGVLTLELTVYGPVKALHDGHYGNWVPNPIVSLAHLLTSMRDENGRILIAGFYDEVVPPTKSELAAVAAMPPVEEALRKEFQIAATEGASLNERIMLPALNVSGIQSGGVGEKASNTLQTSVSPERVVSFLGRQGFATLSPTGVLKVPAPPAAPARIEAARLVLRALAS